MHIQMKINSRGYVSDTNKSFFRGMVSLHLPCDSLSSHMQQPYNHMLAGSTNSIFICFCSYYSFIFIFRSSHVLHLFLASLWFIAYFLSLNHLIKPQGTLYNVPHYFTIPIWVSTPFPSFGNTMLWVVFWSHWVVSSNLEYEVLVQFFKSNFYSWWNKTAL